MADDVICRIKKNLLSMKELTTEQRQFLRALHLSTSGDYEHGSPLIEPFIQDGWCIATDGHRLLRIKQSLVPDNEILYASREKPDVKAVIPDKLDLCEKITFDQIKKTLDKVPLTKTITCEDCHGDGTVTWEYEASDGIYYSKVDDCPVCKGSGEVELDEPVMDECFPIKIKDIYISSKELLWLSRIMEVMQIKDVDLRHVSDRAYFIRDMDINMLIMRVHLSQDGKDYLKHHDPIVLI